jgi:hypothetical protein
MAKSNGHDLECGCPSCVELDSTESTDTLQSRLTDDRSQGTSSAHTVLRGRGKPTH